MFNFVPVSEEYHVNWEWYRENGQNRAFLSFRGTLKEQEVQLWLGDRATRKPTKDC